MKAVKTIVATAVIVFALTTVAMAGVQHLGGSAGEAANAAPDTTAPMTREAARQGDTVTLSAQQFTALLKAVAHDRSPAGTRTASQGHAATGTQAQIHAHAQSHAQAAAQIQHATRTTSHTETHHTGTHSGSHDAGTHTGDHNDVCD